MIKKTMAGCQNHANSKIPGIISKLAKNSLRIIFVFLRRERCEMQGIFKIPCISKKTMKNSPDSSVIPIVWLRFLGGLV